MATAGDILRAARAQPKSQQAAYFKTASAAASGATGASENALSKAASTAKVTTVKSSSSGGSSKPKTTTTTTPKGLTSQNQNPFITNMPAVLNTATFEELATKATVQTTTKSTPSVGSSTPAVYAGVKITDVRHSIVGGDELQVFVQVKNYNLVTTEVRVYLYDSSGQVMTKSTGNGVFDSLTLDTWRDMKPNESASFKLSTNWNPISDLSSVGGAYSVQVVQQGGQILDRAIVNLSTGQSQKGSINPSNSNPNITTPVDASSFTGFSNSTTPTGFTSNTPAINTTTNSLVSNWMTYLVIGGIIYLVATRK